MKIIVLKGVWLFCRYVFVPQWSKHPEDEELSRQISTSSSTGIKEISVQRIFKKFDRWT